MQHAWNNINVYMSDNKPELCVRRWQFSSETCCFNNNGKMRSHFSLYLLTFTAKTLDKQHSNSKLNNHLQSAVISL